MRASTENGFSPIEILVTVFVLAVGVIGAVGMQLGAWRTSQQSAFQTHALHLAMEMADVMRANVGQMRRTDAINPYLRIDHRLSSSLPSSAVSCYSIDARCDADDLAQFEIAKWPRCRATASRSAAMPLMGRKRPAIPLGMCGRVGEHHRINRHQDRLAEKAG